MTKATLWCATLTLSAGIVCASTTPMPLAARDVHISSAVAARKDGPAPPICWPTCTPRPQAMTAAKDGPAPPICWPTCTPRPPVVEGRDSAFDLLAYHPQSWSWKRDAPANSWIVV